MDRNDSLNLAVAICVVISVLGWIVPIPYLYTASLNAGLVGTVAAIWSAWRYGDWWILISLLFFYRSISAFFIIVYLFSIGMFA